MTEKLKLQPGDIWKHKTHGRLYVTDEDSDRNPGYLKCYWSMGGHPQGLAVSMDINKTNNMELLERLGEQGPDGEWRLKK
jgi:hypothetical protein